MKLIEERKKADGHSSDASWMWSKFCELKARYFLLMSTAYRQRQEKRARWKHSSSIWQCLEWEDALPGEAPSAALGQVPDAHQNAKSCFFQAHHEQHHLSTWVTDRAHDFPTPSTLTLGTPDSAWVPILSPHQLEDLHPGTAPACLTG